MQIYGIIKLNTIYLFELYASKYEVLHSLIPVLSCKLVSVSLFRKIHISLFVDALCEKHAF